MKIYLFGMLLCLASCGKGDRVPPEIMITLPTENQLFKGGQTVNLRANITDNFGIQSIHITVKDNSTGSNIIDMDEYPYENAYNLNKTFQVDSVRSYSISIDVTDNNENSTKKGLTIFTR